MMGLDTPETCRGWRSILRISCASSWFLFTCNSGCTFNKTKKKILSRINTNRRENNLSLKRHELSDMSHFHEPEYRFFCFFCTTPPPRPQCLYTTISLDAFIINVLSYYSNERRPTLFCLRKGRTLHELLWICVYNLYKCLCKGKYRCTWNICKVFWRMFKSFDG
jgi:hypothetical protein